MRLNRHAGQVYGTSIMAVAVSRHRSQELLFALGAEIDQHGTRISHSTLPAQPRPLRAGNATECVVCGSPIKPRRTGRRKKYCCYRCRDEARRERNFAASGATRRGSPGIPRKLENNHAKSMTCNGHFVDRGYGILGPREVIEAEAFGNRRWWRLISPDGVSCEVAYAP